MRNDEQAIEQQIQDKGLNAPRLTPGHIDAVIVSETFTVLPSGKCMVCELVLANGFSVRGEASAVSKENFNEEIGREVSRKKAREQIWLVEGYLLQQRLHQHDQSAAAAAMRPPYSFEYKGLSYEAASRKAQAICRAAGESGVTINAAKHLAELHAAMELAKDQA